MLIEHPIVNPDLCTDTDTRLIVSCRFSANKKHDVIFVGEHVKDLMGEREFRKEGTMRTCPQVCAL